MNKVILSILRELAIPISISVADSLFKTGRSLINKMNGEELKEILEVLKTVVGIADEIRPTPNFDELDEKQKTIATTLMPMIAFNGEISDFWHSMIDLCANGSEAINVAPEDFKKAFQAVLNDMGLPFEVKFTIE